MSWALACERDDVRLWESELLRLHDTMAQGTTPEDSQVLMFAQNCGHQSK
jgi:hypothetical protein